MAALAPTGWNESYSYDSFGNMLRHFSFQASYMANNQMVGYPYDAAGNLLSDYVSNLMTWDAESRLSSAGGATYSYDPFGNRVGKNEVGLADTVYFGGRPIARFTAGQWTDLVYGPNGLLAEVPGTQNGAPVYTVSDHLGTTVGNLQADGTFINPLDYTPFGRIFSGNTSDPYLFTGKERDSESGLDYFGARYYASNMGRWMSPDWAASPEAVPHSKLDDPQSLNLYGYVGNNPLNRDDPDGHQHVNRACHGCTHHLPSHGGGHRMSDERKIQIIKGTVGVAAVVLAAPEVAAAAAVAATVTDGLAVGSAALAATGTFVNAVTNLIGGATGTPTDAATDMVTNVTNPVAGAAALATGSAEKGSQIGDLVTVGKAATDVATGQGVKNPAEVVNSVGGAIDAVKSFFTPPPPPAPRPPQQ